MSLFGNKQKSKTSKLKVSAPLTKPKKLVTINVGIMTFDGRQNLKRVRGAWMFGEIHGKTFVLEPLFSKVLLKRDK